MLNLRLLAAAAVLAICSGAASAADTCPPSRSRLVVPFRPAAARDAVARLIAEKMNTQCPLDRGDREPGPARAAMSTWTRWPRAPADGYSDRPPARPRIWRSTRRCTRRCRSIPWRRLRADLHGGVAASGAARQRQLALQDPEGRRGRRQGQARGAADGHARQWHRVPPCRRTAGAAGGLPHAQRPYKGASPAMMDLLGNQVEVQLRQYRRRDAPTGRIEGPRAGREFRPAPAQRAATGRRADRGGVRLLRLRRHHLDRPRGAGRHAAGRGGPHQRGSAQGAQDPGGAGQARRRGAVRRWAARPSSLATTCAPSTRSGAR